MYPIGFAPHKPGPGPGPYVSKNGRARARKHPDRILHIPIARRRTNLNTPQMRGPTLPIHGRWNGRSQAGVGLRAYRGEGGGGFNRHDPVGHFVGGHQGEGRGQLLVDLSIILLQNFLPGYNRRIIWG